MTYSPKIDRHEDDGSRTPMTLIEDARLDAYHAIADAAMELLPYVGEVCDGAFVPCPQASLTTDERADITPWINARWTALLVAVERLYGPQGCGHDCAPIDGASSAEGGVDP